MLFIGIWHFACRHKPRQTQAVYNAYAAGMPIMSGVMEIKPEQNPFLFKPKQKRAVCFLFYWMPARF